MTGVPLQTYSIEIAIVGLVLVAVALAVVFETLEIVQPNEKRVLTVSGEFRRVLDPGIHFVLPLVSTTHAFDVRPQQFDVTIEAATADDETVTVDATFEVTVSDPEATYRAVDDYRRAVKNLARTALRSVLETTDSEDALDAADELERRVHERLADDAADAGITVERVELNSITEE